MARRALTLGRGAVTLGSVRVFDEAHAAHGDAGGRDAGPGDVRGAPDALPAVHDLGAGAEMLTKPPFVPVEPEVFLAAGMSSREEAEQEAAGWLGDMIAGAGQLTWIEGGPGTVVAEPHPELPCVVFSGAREHEGVWVPTLFLMAGKRETDRYWQWASCGERKTPQLGADAIEGAEWVIEGLLPIARSSIRAPTA